MPHLPPWRSIPKNEPIGGDALSGASLFLNHSGSATSSEAGRRGRNQIPIFSPPLISIISPVVPAHIRRGPSFLAARAGVRKNFLFGALTRASSPRAGARPCGLQENFSPIMGPSRRTSGLGVSCVITSFRTRTIVEIVRHLDLRADRQRAVCGKDPKAAASVRLIDNRGV
jgi:hypothetical protein